MPTEPIGHALLVCTFFVVLLTVLVNVGASTWMMTKLKLRAEDEQRCVVSIAKKYHNVHVATSSDAFNIYPRVFGIGRSSLLAPHCREVAHKVLGIGDMDEGRHVHITLDGAEEQQLHVEPSEASAISVAGRSDGSMTSGYSSGYESEHAGASRSSSFSKLRPSAF